MSFCSSLTLSLATLINGISFSRHFLIDYSGYSFIYIIDLSCIYLFYYYFTFPFSSMCMVCVYTYVYIHIFFLCVWPPMCVCFCMSMHACGVFRLMSRIIINSSSTLTTEAKSLIQTQNWPIWPITSKLALGNPLWGWNYRQPTTPIQIYPALGIWTLVLKLAWL